MNELQSKDKILIIGGTGFIGRHLALRCSKYTSEISCLGLPEKNCQKNNSFEFIESDITDKKQLQTVLQNRHFDYIFNCGGYIDHAAFLKGGRKVIDQHFIALMNIIECIDVSSLKGFVQVGSSDEYGGSKAPQKEILRESPISPYSTGKVCASHFIQMLSRFENFPGTVVRFFLIYGPGQDEKRFLPQIITACLKNESFKTSEGKQLRDFCYIDDAVDGMIQAAVSQKAKGHIINIASGKPVYIKDMIQTVVKLIGGGKPVWGAHPYRPGENMELYADAGLAKSLLGWETKVSLEEGLKRTIEYFKNKNT